MYVGSKAFVGGVNPHTPVEHVNPELTMIARTQLNVWASKNDTTDDDALVRMEIQCAVFKGILAGQTDFLVDYQADLPEPIPGVTIRARSLHERADFLAHQDPLPLSGAAPQAVQARRIFGPKGELLDPPERQQIETDVNTKLSGLINQHDLTAHEIVGACIGMIGYAPAEPLLKLFWLTAMAEGVTQFRDKKTVHELGNLILQSMKAMDLPNSELRLARYLLSQQVHTIVSTNISGAGPG